MDAVLRPSASDSGFVHRLRRHRVMLAGVASIALAGILSRPFLQADNLANLLIQLAPLGIVVIGQTLVVLVAGLDLSVASVMATSAVLCTLFPAQNSAVLPMLASITALGIVVGGVNGWLVTKRHVSPFLATLATMIVLVGVRLTITHGAPSGNLPPLVRTVAIGAVGGVPYSLFLLLALAFAVSFVLQRTTFGRMVRAAGASPNAAALVGYPVATVKTACYMASSVFAAWGGVLLAGYVGSIDNWVGKGYELDSIVAAVVGGVALTGGVGTVVGALSGTVILMVVSNLVLLLGLPVQFQLLLKGVAIVVAAALYVDRQKE